jgi:SsrA-binding protein
MSPQPEGEKTVATNRRARHDYQILERFEAWLENMHIPPYEQGEKRGYDPLRDRKLLLHRREIERLIGKQKEQGLALIPVRVYFVHGLAKVELGLGRGKREYEKRQAIAKREHEREMERAAGRRR